MLETSNTVVTVAAVLALLMGCAEADPSEPQACGLPDEPTYQVIEAELQRDISNSACPEFDAAELDAELSADDVCEQTIDDCSIILECELEAFTVHGKLSDKEGRLRGRVEVRSPLVCVYFVTAEYT